MNEPGGSPVRWDWREREEMVIVLCTLLRPSRPDRLGAASQSYMRSLFAFEIASCETCEIGLRRLVDACDDGGGADGDKGNVCDLRSGGFVCVDGCA